MNKRWYQIVGPHGCDRMINTDELGRAAAQLGFLYGAGRYDARRLLCVEGKLVINAVELVVSYHDDDEPPLPPVDLAAWTPTCEPS